MIQQKDENSKMNDLEYIKKFSKITISRICKENNINKSNIWAGRCSAKNNRLIRKALEAEIAKLTLEDYEHVKQENSSI